jgi:hypothetical protein
MLGGEASRVHAEEAEKTTRTLSTTLLKMPSAPLTSSPPFLAEHSMNIQGGSRLAANACPSAVETVRENSCAHGAMVSACERNFLPMELACAERVGTEHACDDPELANSDSAPSHSPCRPCCRQSS